MKATGDGERLLSGSYDKNIIMWDIENAEAISECHTGSKVESIAIVPNKAEKGSNAKFPTTEFVSGHDDNTAKLWSFEEATESKGYSITILHTFKGHTGIIKKVAMHPTEAIMATASLDNTWKLWSTRKDEYHG